MKPFLLKMRLHACTSTTRPCVHLNKQIQCLIITDYDLSIILFNCEINVCKKITVLL